MAKVLISGITGFLGSHIAIKFVSEGWEVVGLKRTNSDLWRCKTIIDKIIWVDLDSKNWKEKVIELQPNILVHSAWGGVAAGERLSYESQIRNINLVHDILEICKSSNAKFIGLGSQAEYGTFSGKIDEEYETTPNTAYGVVKLMSYNLVKGFCEENNLFWFWLRLFPLFGDMESENWLIPSVINKIIEDNQIDLTPGEQMYAYLYVKDFANCVFEIGVNNTDINNSGVYNISGDKTITLRYLIEKIRDKVNPNAKLNFGALQYRAYQSMHMHGDMTKFFTNIASVNFSNFDDALDQTIDFYIKKK